MMNKAIEEFAKQFAFTPRIENEQNFTARQKFVVSGMGGSHLAADILKTIQPSLDIIIHKNYGLPDCGNLEERLIIASSYSGNTEETIDSFQKALGSGLSCIAISTGGALLEIARKQKAPFIEIPQTNIQPRLALGLSSIAMAHAMRQRDLLLELNELSTTLHPHECEKAGKELAHELQGCVPVVYTSLHNEAIAYNWKIKFNETGKIPAFYNVFPELNHNEMTGFDVQETSRALSQNFFFIILHDSDDDPRTQKRMDILAQLYRDRDLKVKKLTLDSQNKSHKVFSSLVLADWTAYYTAVQYGLEPEQVPMVEEFKKLIAEV